MNNDLMFSSETDKWNTPSDLVLDLKTVFPFDLDVCASGPNVCDTYYTEEDNALLDHNFWTDYKVRWCNPPYGRGISAWYEKAYLSYGTGFTVMLVPSRPDTIYWHNFVPHASFVVDIKGRLKFGDASNSAPFPSSFVVFGEINIEQKRKLASYGQWYVYGGEL